MLSGQWKGILTSRLDVCSELPGQLKNMETKDRPTSVKAISKYQVRYNFLAFPPLMNAQPLKDSQTRFDYNYIQTSLCVFRVLGEAADQDEQIEHLAAALVRQESDSGQEHPSTLQLEFHSHANG